MKKRNCWEVKNCGREVGGTQAETCGVCPTAIENALDGVHGGTNGGRACWMIAGTSCQGKVSGTFAKKFGSCRECEFFLLVLQEEGDAALPLEHLARRLLFAKRLD